MGNSMREELIEEVLKEQVDICEGCVRKRLFGKKCRFFWYGKRECHSKCYSEEEMLKLDILRSE